MTSNLALPKAERGAVLIVSLIMLLLLTVIGLASMRGTSLQESMAGNLRDSDRAFQAAEAALRHGEEVVHQKFLANTLNTLDAAPLSGTYAGFSDMATDPKYRIVQLAKLRTSTEAGVPIEEEGALVRVESEGYGASINNDKTPSSHVELRSTFLVEQ